MILRTTTSKDYIVPSTLEDDASLVRQEFVGKSENLFIASHSHPALAGWLWATISDFLTVLTVSIAQRNR